MIYITPTLSIHENEIQLSYIRSPGPGGQNVNKVASAVLLRFDVTHSTSLPEDVRARLIRAAGNKMTLEGELLIKASRHRTQERNKQDAIDRLIDLIKRVAVPPKRRKKTKPTFSSKQNRLQKKKFRGKAKKLRQRPVSDV